MTKNTTLPKNIISSPLTFIVAVFLWAGFAQAQESTNASCGVASGSSGTVSYTVGRVVHSIYIGNSENVFKRVHQAYETTTVGINKNESKNTLSVFPNPSADNVILQANEFEHLTLNYQLCDMHGKEISKGQIIAKQTQINTAGLSSATYFINVTNQENQKVQTLKIIKD
jgi:hypothetical protein